MRESRIWEVVTDDGVRLAVETWPGREPDAPLVLGIHGISANRRAFLPLVAELDGDVEFVAFDCRGRGDSDKPADVGSYGHARHAADAACVLRALGRRADVLMGQSMGAWDGLLLAADSPELVGALVLGDGGYFSDLPDDVDPADHVDRLMGTGWRQRLSMVVPSREVLVAALSSAPPYRDLWSPEMEAMFDLGLETLPDGSVRNRCSVEGVVHDSTDYFTPREAPYVRATLPQVTCPVHLVRAPRGFDISDETREPLLPDATVEEFRRVVPQLVVDTVPDTNHFSVNFGKAGVAALSDAIRKAVR